MATRAQEVDGGYRLWRKMWITSSPVADVFVVWAKGTKAAPSAPSAAFPLCSKKT